MKLSIILLFVVLAGCAVEADEQNTAYNPYDSKTFYYNDLLDSVMLVSDGGAIEPIRGLMRVSVDTSKQSSIYYAHNVDRRKENGNKFKILVQPSSINGASFYVVSGKLNTAGTYGFSIHDGALYGFYNNGKQNEIYLTDVSQYGSDLLTIEAVNISELSYYINGKLSGSADRVVGEQGLITVYAVTKGVGTGTASVYLSDFRYAGY